MSDTPKPAPKDKSDSKRLPVVTGEFDFRASYVLGSTGPLSKSLPDYQVRTPQITLAEKIQESFEEKKHLVAEAKTGTGKSFANALAALETSIGTGTPVVISTHTIALQEQMYEKDIPFLVDQLKLSNVKVALAKGRGNYVSIRRARIAIREKQNGYYKLNTWLNSTDDGTLSDMDFKANTTTWNRSKSDTDQCLGEHCSTFDDCFYQKARKKLGESHIIITNHNLVLLDLKMKSTGLKGVLPEYKYLIFDEGHEVEQVARKVFTFELKQKDLPLIFNEIYNDNNTGFLNGMLTATNMTIRESLTNPNEEIDPQAQAIKEMSDSLELLFEKNEEFFRRVGAFIGSVPMKRFIEKDSIDTEIIGAIESTLGCIKELSFINDPNHKSALDFAAKRCTEIALGIEKILTLPNIKGKDYAEIVAWASSRLGGNRNRIYAVTCAPIFLGPTMKKIVLSRLSSVVFTSATMATGGQNPFRMFESAMGLRNPERLRLPPVFDYEKQATIVVIDDMPEQKSDNYVEVMAQQVKKFSKATGGGAFVLFTSFKVMNEVYELSKASIEMADCKIFCQGKDLTRKQMINEFKNTKRGVLFGVASFWTGVDIPGRALRNLIITKLPFPAPNDPLMQAQQEIFEKFGRNFFMERSVPMTALMLKQGFGRLIRKSTDKGIVVILDSRVVTKRYGPMLLSSLPSTCPVKRCLTTTKLTKD
jgi:ATP-dependent DNA helicase DinG